MPLPSHALVRFGFALSCATFACGAAPGSDLPVPHTEARETISVQLDLPKTASCTEQFDLAVYANRAIEMIEWTTPEGSPPGADGPDCEQRIVHVRFLSRKTSKAEVMALLRANATRVADAPKSSGGSAHPKGTP